MNNKVFMERFLFIIEMMNGTVNKKIFLTFFTYFRIIMNPSGSGYSEKMILIQDSMQYLSEKKKRYSNNGLSKIFKI